MDTKNTKTMFVRTMYVMVILALAFSVTGNVEAQGPNPRIVVSEAGDWFWTTDFSPGPLAISIYESPVPGAVLLWEGSRDADEHGFLIIGFDDHGVDLLPGHYLVIADELTEKGIVLETVTMEVFDTENEIMAGTAPLGREVWAMAGPQDWQQPLIILADPVSGAWFADFKTIGFDITEDMRPWSFAHIYDGDGDANEAGTPPAPPSTWRDDFDADTLSRGWYWQNGDTGAWSLGAEPGFLQVGVSNTSAVNGNLLLRQVQQGDFAIETHVIFEPNTNFQFAGLVIYQDGYNDLALGRAFCDVVGACVGNGIYFDYVANGEWVNGNFGTVVGSPNEAYLRLERRGEMVKAFFSYEGTTWFEIGTHWIPADFQVQGVGLTAGGDYDTSDPNISAYFDYFELTEGWGFLPEGFHDFDQGDVPDTACGAGGWAADPDDRETDLAVEVNIDGTSLPEWLYAGEYREDLDAAGVCVDGKCAFSTSLWGMISSYEPHSVVVYAQDVPSGDWVQLSSSPKTLTCRTYDIYVFDKATGTTRQITNLRDAGEYNPSWSPNGKFIAHDVVMGDAHDIYVTTAATRQSVRLRGAGGGNDAAWSPSGLWIAFDRRWVGDPNLYVVPFTGGQRRLVRRDAVSADWSPNSTRIVFQDLADGGKLKTVGPFGNLVITVADYGENPAWSPDGKWIAYQRDGDIWKVRVGPAGAPLAEPIQVTSLASWADQPAWSASSLAIIFQSGFGNDQDLWKVPAAGGMPTWLNGVPEYGDYDPDTYKGLIAYASVSPDSQAERPWVAAYSLDLTPGQLTDGTYSYHFDFEWTLPEPGSFSGQGGEFVVSGGAPLYEGNVLLRGPAELRGLETPDGLICEGVEEIHPNQPMRFLIGWLYGYDQFVPMTYAEARAHFNSITAKAVWGDGMSADLVRHEIIPWTSQLNWPAYVCTYTR